MRKLIYLLPFALMVFGSCLKSGSDDVTVATPSPSGTFTGTFTKIHLNKSIGKTDSVKSNFTMKMSKDSGFRVLADTTTIHAGSKGSFQLITDYITFYDSTFPKTGIPAKTHLNGTYAYAFDGSIFQFYTLSADTLLFKYDLKKTN